MKVDFHLHSTASDGTCAPSEVAARARGFAAFALTDHDNADGVAECAARAAADGTPFVPGVELSIDPGRGFDRFHLLALGVDPRVAEFRQLLNEVFEGRRVRNARIVANFRRLGIDVLDGAESVQVAERERLGVFAFAHGEVLARPHFAKWLVERGLAPDVKTAFSRYLASDAPSATSCYEERLRPAQEETFRIVHAAGGVCVMAHPRYWRDSWKTTGPDYAAAERELARLKECGLDGLEAFYQANTIEETISFCRLAKRFGLLLSAGSDFHGTTKPSVPFGMDVPDNELKPLLERLRLGLRPDRFPLLSSACCCVPSRKDSKRTTASSGPAWVTADRPPYDYN